MHGCNNMVVRMDVDQFCDDTVNEVDFPMLNVSTKGYICKQMRQQVYY